MEKKFGLYDDFYSLRLVLGYLKVEVLTIVFL